MRIPQPSYKTKNSNISIIIIFGLLAVIIISMAQLISGGMEFKVTILLVGVIASGICFFNTEMALYLILFSMLFSPEFTIGGELAEGRRIIIRFEDIIIFIVFSSWVVKTALYEGVGLITKTPLNQAIKLYVFISLFCTLLGAIFGRVGLLSGLMYVFKYMEYFLVYFIFVNNIKEKEQIKRFIIAAFVVAFFTAIYATMQIPLGGRVSAPFEGQTGEPNTLGGYLILIIAVAGGLWSTISEHRIKIYLLALVAFLFIPFVFTLSRSSYIAIIPLFFAFFFLTDKKLILSVLIIASLFLAPIILPEKAKERVTDTFTPHPYYEETESIGNIEFDPSTSARISSFKYALEKWSEKPLFGWGITGVGIIDSMYFRLLAETGIVGFLAFLFLAYTILRYLYETLKTTKDPLTRGLSLGMIAGTLALLAHSIGAATFIIIRIMEPYWFFMAAIVSLSLNEKGLSGEID